MQYNTSAILKNGLQDINKHDIYLRNVLGILYQKIS